MRAARHRVRIPESDVELAVLDWGGEGPVALLHHANGFCAGVWDPVAERLRDAFRVLALDARGHGASAAPRGARAYAWPRLAEDLAAVAAWTCEHTGRRRIAVGVGHSFGGTLTLGAAAGRPGLFERALLLDPVIFPPERRATPEAQDRRNALSERARKRRSEWPTREEARAWFAERELFADWDADALDAYVAEGLRSRLDGHVELCCAGDVEATVFETGHTLDPFAVAPRVSIPVRIVRAARGDFPREAYKALAELLPDASLDELDTGHLVPMERPDLVADAIRRFFEETERRA